MLKFTGERLVPNSENCEPNFAKKMYQEHIARYLFASQFAENKDILDVGCGVGYGSLLLVKSGAKLVEAFDLSDEAIEYARKHYFHDYISYRKLNAETFKFNKKFDLIICFELIEHVEKQEAVIKNIYNHLKEDGLVLISTPRKLPEKRSDFHTKEFYFEEFNKLLKKYFNFLVISFENNHFVSLITDSFPSERKTNIEVMENVFNADRCDYFICICSNEKINVDEIKNIMVINDESYIRHLERDIYILNGAISQKDQQLEMILNSFSWKITAPLRALFKKKNVGCK